jgi:hypothetical protein
LLYCGGHTTNRPIGRKIQRSANECGIFQPLSTKQGAKQTPKPTPCSIRLLEKTFAQMVKIFSALYRTPRSMPCAQCPVTGPFMRSIKPIPPAQRSNNFLRLPCDYRLKLYAYVTSSIRATCPAHLIPFVLLPQYR